MSGLVEVAPGLGKVLGAAGYSPAGLSAALLYPAPPDAADAGRLNGGAARAADCRLAPDYIQSAVLARRLASSRLADLVELFLVGSTVSRARAADALNPMGVDALIDCGLLMCRDEQVRAGVRIGWCDGTLVGHDWQDGRRLRREHVLGVGQGSLTLADLTVRRPGGDVLDVATGSGVQALLAAGHARTVTGTDINARALHVAAFGAALNNLHNVVWHEGSLLEPVAEDTFDLVTLNPPYVISPENTLWRDARPFGGATGGLCRQLVAEVARRLRPDGWATMLASWLHSADEGWSTPVRSWMTELGCDAWVLRFASQDPLTYAHHWLAQTERTSEGFASTLDRWLDYYRNERIDTIATGAIILHRTQDTHGRTWADDMPGCPTGPAGEQIRRVFDQRDQLSRLADPGRLLDEVLAPLPGTSLDQVLDRGDGEYRPTATHMWVHPGLAISAAVPPVALPVILELDGERPLRDLVANAAETTGFDSDEVRDQTLSTAGRLVQLGLVEWRRES